MRHIESTPLHEESCFWMPWDSQIPRGSRDWMLKDEVLGKHENKCDRIGQCVGTGLREAVFCRWMLSIYCLWLFLGISSGIFMHVQLLQDFQELMTIFNCRFDRFERLVSRSIEYSTGFHGPCLHSYAQKGNNDYHKSALQIDSCLFWTTRKKKQHNSQVTGPSNPPLECWLLQCCLYAIWPPKFKSSWRNLHVTN